MYIWLYIYIWLCVGLRYIYLWFPKEVNPWLCRTKFTPLSGCVWKNHRSSGYRYLKQKHREVDCCQGKTPNPKFDALTVQHKNGQYILHHFQVNSWILGINRIEAPSSSRHCELPRQAIDSKLSTIPISNHCLYVWWCWNLYHSYQRLPENNHLVL